MGRAARNLNGRAILYADRVTGSMERAIAESEKRRNIQIEFNLEHGITPEGVKKKVLDVMEGAYAAPGTARGRQRKRGVAEAQGGYAGLRFEDPAAIGREITRLEGQMFEQARNLAFEEAARTRDQILELKKNLLG
jgi:excinuclease ABC subunit B